MAWLARRAIPFACSVPLRPRAGRLAYGGCCCRGPRAEVCLSRGAKAGCRRIRLSAAMCCPATLCPAGWLLVEPGQGCGRASLVPAVTRNSSISDSLAWDSRAANQHDRVGRIAHATLRPTASCQWRRLPWRASWRQGWPLPACLPAGFGEAIHQRQQRSSVPRRLQGTVYAWRRTIIQVVQ